MEMGTNGYFRADRRCTSQRRCLSSASLLVIPGDFRCSVLRSDERITHILVIHAFASPFADFRQFPRGFLNTPSPIDRGHAPGEIGHAPVGTGSGAIERSAGKRERVVWPSLVSAMTILARTGLTGLQRLGSCGIFRLGGGDEAPALELSLGHDAPGMGILNSHRRKSGSYLSL